MAENGGSAVLASGDAASLDVVYTAPVANAGAQINNTLTASGHNDDLTESSSATATAAVTYQDVAPSIAVAKSHTGTINEGTSGQTLTYHFTVTNTSAASTEDRKSVV